MPKLTLWVEPVPASRPRLGRRGIVYYPKRYNQFRSQMAEALATTRMPKLSVQQLIVNVQLFCKAPKSPANPYPIGDVDNYAKGVLDCLNTKAWKDDSQIVELRVSKQYSSSPRIVVTYQESRLEPERIIRSPRTVP